MVDMSIVVVVQFLVGNMAMTSCSSRRDPMLGYGERGAGEVCGIDNHQ